MVALIFGIVLNSLVSGTANYEACQMGKSNHPACWNSNQLRKLGEWSCGVQGKKLEGSSDCK